MMSETIKIMIVDDNPDDRSLAIREIKRNFRDVEVNEIVDSNELKDALEGCDFDIVITDYHIRWTDGMKVLREVKKRKPDCPVIMFTGTGNEEIAVQAMKSGLEDYVVKSPKHFVRLSASVHSAIEDIKERKERRELEDLYTRLFERVPIPLYSVTVDGKILAANSAMVDLLGFKSKEDLYSCEAHDFYPDKSLRNKEISILQEKGVIKGYEIPLERIDGENIWVKDNAYVIRDEDNEVIYIEGSMEDVTAINKANIKLKEEKDKIERLHDFAYKIVGCTTEEEVYDLSIHAAENILGFSACTIHKVEDDELVVKATKDGALEVGSKNPVTGIAGKSYRERRSILVKDVDDAEDAEPANKEYRSAISIPIDDIGVFLNISTEKNRFDENDLKMGEILVSHMTDALKRIRYEKGIKEKEEMHRGILENTGTAMLIIGKDMNISMMNKECEKLIGYSQEEVEDKKFSDFVFSEDLSKLKDSIDDLFNKDIERSDMIMSIQNRYNDIRDVFQTASSLPGSDLVLISMIDITQHKKNLDSMENSQEIFRIALEGAPIGMLLVDSEGNIIEANRSALEMTGYTEKEMLSFNLNHLIKDLEKWERELKDLTEGQKGSCSCNVSLIKKDSERLSCEVKALAVRKKDKSINNLLIYLKEGGLTESGGNE